MFNFLALNLDVGKYNYNFELCSLIFLFVLAMRFFSRRKFPSKTNRLFGVAIICAIFDLSLDIIGSMMLEYANVPIWVCELVNGAFYCFQVAFPVMFASYIIYASGKSFKENYKLVLLLIPAAIFMLFQFSNIFSHLMFRIVEDAEGQLVLEHTGLFVAFYITEIFYLLLTGVLNAIYKRKIKDKQYLVFYVCISIIIAGILFQIKNPSILMSGTAITISLELTFGTIANPDYMIDKVSGLFNYNALSVYLDEEFKLDRKQDFIIVTLNNTHQIHEALGREVSNQLYSTLGSFVDSLNRENWVFRVLEYNFVISVKEKNTIRKTINKIQNKLNAPIIIENNRITVSYNIITFTCHGQFKNTLEFSDFVQHILTKIKSDEGSETVVKIDSKYIDNISKEKLILSIVKEALEENKYLSMYYQPIYELKTQKFNHAEALIRLIDPNLGFISPADFIPIVEKNGLAPKLDEYVIKSTCLFLKEHPELEHLDINISSAEFFDNPADKFLDLISQFNINPNRLCFEVTETASIKYPKKIKSFMEKMIQAGFSFAIDDFGTGYSNVSQVINKPFELVKLDKTLLNPERRNAIFLSSIVHMFKKLKTPMVIEGVETKEELEVISKLDIEYVQGYIFSRPLPEKDFVEFLKKHNEEL